MKIAIVGCTHAGVAAAVQALTAKAGAEVTIYERNDNIAFLSSGAAVYLTGEISDAHQLFYATPDHLRQLGANLKMQHSVTKIDTNAKKIWAVNLRDGTTTVSSYDKLIITTGSWPVIPAVNGIDNPAIYLCKTYQQIKKLVQAAKSASQIAVIGGNYIGCELAAALCKSGKRVTLVDQHERLLGSSFDPQYAERVAALFDQRGVKLALGSPVTAFDQTADAKVIVKTDNGGEYSADLALLCTGVKPNSSLLKGQVEMAANGAIITNEYLQTSDPDVYAAGDVTMVHFNPGNEKRYLPLATSAMRQGTIAGVNAFGNTMKYAGTQGTIGVRLFDYVIAATGLTIRQARKLGIAAETVTVTDNYRPEFMPSTAPVTMTLVWDKNSRVILGGQLMSKHDISQSANLLSTCIKNKDTIDFLAFVDMLFQPSFDRPFNYINLLGQAAMAKASKQ